MSSHATVVHGDYEWDAEKAAPNLARHGVAFEEAMTVFSSPVTVEKFDELAPDRVITIGFSSTARLLTVVTTEVIDDRVRIISARPATPAEHVEFARG